MSLDISVLLAMAAFTFAGAVKGMVGVGFPVVAMSLLTVWMDPVAAIALISIPVLITNAWQAFQAKNCMAVFQRFWTLIAAMVVTTWIGGLAVAHVDTDVLLTAVGAIAVFFSVLSVSSPNLRIPAAKERLYGTVTGLGTGIVGGLTTVHGPPVMMYLLALDLKKDEFVGTVGLIWFCASIPMVGAYIYEGVLGPSEIMWSAVALIPALTGLYIGQLVRYKINQRLFKNILVAALFVIGLNLIRRGVF